MIDDSPRIRFFNKRSGESVAYAMHGTGPVLLVPAWWVSHLELDWEVQEYRAFFQQLGEHFTVIRYDRPGAGLSGRDRDSFTLESEVETLSELVEHLSLSRCTLLGVSCGGPSCITFTQQNPEKVKQIIFIDSYVDGADLCDLKIQGALCDLVSAYWGLGAKAILDLFDPDMDSALKKQLSKTHKKSASAEMAKDLLELSFKMDAIEAVSQLQVPALVIHRASDRTVPFDAGRKLASMLANAQFVSVKGSAHLPWMGENADTIMQEMLKFTGSVIAPSPSDSENEKKEDLERENAAEGHFQFRPMGDVWALSFANKTVHVKDARGLHDIALLIRHTGKEIQAAEMVSGDQSFLIEAESVVLDNAAISDFQQRLRHIHEEKQTAAQSGDELVYAELEQEEEAILGALKHGVGLGGRQRKFNSAAEKARKAVAARIKTAVTKIASVHPELGEHLQSSLKTGNFCSYSSRSNIHWLV